MHALRNHWRQRRPPRKILSVNTADIGGGAERIAGTLFRAFRERGCDSWFVVGDRQSDDPQVIELHRSPFIDYRPYAEPAAQAQLAQRRSEARQRGWYDWEHPYSHRLGDIAGGPPDVVQFHNVHGGYFDLRAAVAISRRWPTFITLHDYWWWTGHCAYSLGCQRWRSGCGDCTLLHVPPEAKTCDATRHNWTTKAELLRRCRLHVVSPTQRMLDLAQQSILAPAIVDTHLIPHGIDLALFRPASQAAARHALDLPPGAFIAMFAAKSARSSPFKDYATVRAACELAARRRPLWMLAVGEAGPDERRGGATIRHVPYVATQSQMALHYQAADVYLHAAHNEAFGIVLAEALACGLPVVATAVDGIPEVFRDGVHGFLVPPADVPAMADALTRLVDDRLLRRRMSTSAVRHARRNFSDRRMIDRYLASYETAIASNRRMPAAPAA
jgi:glycosyltransferase involved in cell wall biosynthesis